MFESLIEQPEISQEVLTKLTGELIARYEIRQDSVSAEFGSDLAGLAQQLRLYGEVLQQLTPHTFALRAFHQQLFRLFDFLARLATRAPRLPPPHPLPPAFCAACNGLLEHRNVRQLHRELVNCHQLALERSDRGSERSVAEEAEITQEELLVRRMGNLQQNITERQVNLVRCIDDFENMRNDMMLGLRRREFDRDFDSFDIKAYALHLTTHFLSTLTRVEQKIGLLKRSIHAVEDQAVQTAPSPDVPSQPARVEPKPQPNRSEADFRRLNDLKTRLEENCRRFQLQLRETQSKVEVLEGQNKILREEVASEKFRREAREKAARNAERDEKLKEEERAKREGLELLMSGDQLLAGEFETRFLENYAGSGSRRASEDDMVPIIKATFKRTFEGFFNQRLSLNVSSSPHSRPRHSPLPPTREVQSVERRRMSRKKTLKLQLDADGSRELSRFANKRGPSGFMISSQINYKLLPKATLLASPVPHSVSSSAYKKAVLYTEGSVKRKRNHFSNLNSVLSEYKQNQRDQSNEHKLLAKKYSQTLQTQHSEQLRAVRKGRKIKLSRNHSQLLDSKLAPFEAQRVEETGTKGMSLEGVRMIIDSAAVKQFLFLSELGSESALAPRPTHKRDQQHLSIQSLSSETPAKKEKVILSLQEINYLTNFYSLLAKIHMVDAGTYDKLKRWIFSKGSEKAEAGRQSMVLKQIVSEIVFKHRQCKYSSSLCPHLSAFLQEMQTQLKSIDI